MFCYACGREFAPEEKFCPKCGTARLQLVDEDTTNTAHVTVTSLSLEPHEPPNTLHVRKTIVPIQPAILTPAETTRPVPLTPVSAMPIDIEHTNENMFDDDDEDYDDDYDEEDNQATPSSPWIRRLLGFAMVLATLCLIILLLINVLLKQDQGGNASTTQKVQSIVRLSKEKPPEEAENLLRDGIADYPKEFSLYEALCQLYIDQKDYESAYRVASYGADNFASQALKELRDQLAIIQPLCDPMPGTYVNEILVTLSCEVPNARIYFTTDGTDPVEGGNLYSTPISITSGEVEIRAISVNIAGGISQVRSMTFLVEAGQ